MLQYNNLLITGASSGLGKALALLFAKRNVTLHLLGRNVSELQKISSMCQEKGAKIVVHAVDLTKKNLVKKTMTTLREVPFDTVIACAGISAGSGANDCEPLDQMERLIESNLLGVMRVVQAIFERMLQNKQGHIVLIGSMAGQLTLPKASAYSISKKAIHHYGEILHCQGYPHHVHVTTCIPGYIKTPMTMVNQFPMPGIISAEKAALKIYMAMKRQKRVLYFPLFMKYFIGGLNLLPFFLKRWCLNGLPAKSKE